MEAIQRIQPLDVVLVLAWAAVVAWGWRSGVVRQLIMLAAFYLAVIWASQAYQPLGSVLSLVTGVDTRPQWQLVAYVLLIGSLVALLYVLSRRVYPHTRLAARRRLDSAFGALVAAVWGLMLAIMLLVVFQFYTVTFWPGQENTQRALDAQIRRSQVAPVLRFTLSPLWEAMQPWFPARVAPAGRG